MFVCVSLRLIRLLCGFMNTWMPFRCLPAIVAACRLSFVVAFVLGTLYFAIYGKDLGAGAQPTG